MTVTVQRPRYETAAIQITEFITGRGLQPGDRLPTERELGEQLGVSRTVVREAIKALTATGFVRARQGSGLYVAREPIPFAVAAIDLSMPVDPEHILSLFEFRATIEMQTARLAAERITPRELQALDLAVSLCRNGAEEMDWSRFGEGDIAFHTGIAEATKNPFMAAAIASVHRLCSHAISMVLASAPGSPRIAADQHAAVVAAIREGQGDVAAQAMSQHIQTSATNYRQEVRRRIASDMGIE